MRKALSLWFVCLFIALTFAGCTVEPQLPEDTEPDVQNTLESTEEPETTVTESLPTENEYFGEGFEIKGEKYEYKGDDVLILHVKNQTDVDYDIQVIVTFYDENNEKTLHHEKYFKGFGANWENYFVFRPEKPFARFRCEIEKIESTETAYAKALSQGTDEDALRLSGIITKRWVSPEGFLEFFDDWHMFVRAGYKVLNDSDQHLYFSPVFVLFDKSGEIFVIDDSLESFGVGPSREYPEQAVPRPVYRCEDPWPFESKGGEISDEDFNELLPEELRGDITFIVSFLVVDVAPTSPD